MKASSPLQAGDLVPALETLFPLAARKVVALDRAWDTSRGTPVFTAGGTYTTRGWTEWTQGFQYGLALLCHEAMDDARLLKLGRARTLERMLPHVTHLGVHDHGFNNLSSYGNLLRLAKMGRHTPSREERAHLADLLRCSGAVQAARWSEIRVDAPHPLCANAPQLGHVYSFNGPHSLFVDTMRTLRVLGVGWKLGHALLHENDRRADLLQRLVQHGLATNRYLIFHGGSGHAYDVRGRTAHEAVFNRADGSFRCRSSQQGYSPFSTWTRGLAWAMLGFAEELEFLATIEPAAFEASVGLPRRDVLAVFEQAAVDTCDHYLDDATAADGIPYWDDGAPGLAQMPDWRERPADPWNDHEPVDASAAAIAAQGLLRLGTHLGKSGARYSQAGFQITRTLLSEAYLATSTKHQGLLLHSVYHRPNGWDHIPEGRRIPCGESSLWGDYHLLELGVLVHALARRSTYPTFFNL